MIARSIEADLVLDCSGMACPMPILKTKKAIDSLQAGQVLKLLATDPGSVSDIGAFTKKTGHHLLELDKKDSTYIFYIKKV